MIGEAEYFHAAASDTDEIQALLEFVAWCVSEGNQAGTIVGKLSSVLHFHRVNLHMELPTSSALIKRTLKGVARSHVATETPTSPHFMGCTVGRTGPGLIFGSGRPRSSAASRVGSFFRGEVGRNLRLAERSGAPRALLNEERRGVI